MPSSPSQASLVFPAQQSEALTVSQLAGDLRSLIESRFSGVLVEGEISNFKRHTSGHCYFTLKDERAQLRAVMWRSTAERVFFQPKDGMLVRLRGDASVYEQRGDLQLVVRSLELAGEGALQKAFEELKRKLAAEGLFDSARKKRLPAFPQTVGVVTSGSGAALRDILSILGRRFPCVQVLVCPVQVQGVGAAESIREAIEAFNAEPPESALRADVLIVGRGGGSLEDLWAFNEEMVARAVYLSGIPVISAVGHETDFSITDFVADVRAATPSMAAELAVPDRAELAASINTLCAGATSGLLRRIERQRRRVESLVSTHAFRRPIDRLRQYTQRTDELSARLERAATRFFDGKRSACSALNARLELLNPERPLDRGYALVEHDGALVRSAAELKDGDAVSLRFRDGRAGAVIAPDKSIPEGRSAGVGPEPDAATQVAQV